MMPLNEQHHCNREKGQGLDRRKNSRTQKTTLACLVMYGFLLTIAFTKIHQIAMFSGAIITRSAK